ncbi:YpmS family protein [Virgibacillus sp. NKC19-3]|uniref:YpmS family protein n=1 Tax=Virgibacillus saliphilus TaxID=2831674 RepID=UPI001C9B56EB|nr:YpmS family protein [Virgibacillus sp. NKC19-3]MBY7144857.1 YpmS family protein [Virgibacillus sp. NKC19-3]
MPQRKEDHQSKTIKWKALFFGLLSVNILFFLVIVALIFWPVSENIFPSNDEQESRESSEFTVRTTKDNLNELVNAYIDQALSNTGHEYRISLEEDIHLIGELPVFSSTVPLSVHLEPIVQENGDLVLEQRSISLGLLDLPNQKIMEYMERYLSMPEWVTINPKDEEIYVGVTEMDLQSNFEVSVEHIDLEANNLAFNIRIPYRTLGIEHIEP